MKEKFIVCPNCGWEVDRFLHYLVKDLEWLPPCSRCNSMLEGFRITMTYQDLQKRLLEAADCENIECVKEFNALRAVVELHKPYGSLCYGCSDEEEATGYPCPTIKAIEKELL